MELDAPTNRYKDLVQLAPYIPAALEATRTHRFVSVHADGWVERLAER
ncbi:MAG: hypothetical protein HY721_18550 [Planctomycetes bacterium]|nr:hypothetical protein [Planctomycetota bacterium]